MKHIICDRARPKKIGQFIEDGNFRYHLDFQWAKWPEELRRSHTLNACFDDEGRLYVATDDKTHPIVVFGPEGDYLRSIGAGLFAKAHSVFITKDQTLLVADSSTDYHVVREITLSGELVRDFGFLGRPGNSGYDLNYLSVLRAEGRVPNDPVWNLRAEDNARLDSVRRLGTPFCRPCAMVVNKRGEYFAADGYGNDAVHKFNCDGSYSFSWGGPGQEPGHFRLVHDIQIDCLDRVWVADRENSRVQVFDQTGKLLAVIGGNLMRIGGIWTDEKYGYIGELDGGITILDMELNVLAQLGSEDSAIHAHGLTESKNGDLFVLTNKKRDKYFASGMRTSLVTNRRPVSGTIQV